MHLILRKVRFVLIITAVFAVLLWAAYKWAWPYVANPFIDFAVLKQETLQSSTAAEALVVRTETAVQAPSDGTLHPEIGGSERVSKGTRVGLIEGPSGGFPVYAPHAGLIYWEVDGLEDVLQAGNVLPSEDVPELTPSAPLAGDTVAKGDAVFRVVDNLSPVRLQFNVPSGVLPQTFFSEGDTWRLILDGEEYRGRVTLVFPDYDQTRVELVLNQFPETLLRDRRVQCAVITRELSGFIVPRSALVLQSGSSGLYLLRKDRIEWQEVRVDGQVGENVQVSGENLTEGGQYVVNPWLAGDGRRFLRSGK